jgi:hypothetical protein
MVGAHAPPRVGTPSRGELARAVDDVADRLPRDEVGAVEQRDAREVLEARARAR